MGGDWTMMFPETERTLNGVLMFRWAEKFSESVLKKSAWPCVLSTSGS